MTHCLMSTQVLRLAPLPRGVRPRAAAAAAELKAALDELRAVKRLMFVEPRLAEGETRAGAVLRAGLELAPVLRPSAAVWKGLRRLSRLFSRIR